ncbi:unnamed protein product [Pleuronectes platessa]|uniref:Uncharacterized protein n=1 Tax=Pleuronectes platessa TaxID=8262 RepID=A0A9N7Z6U8_PLEPL|nr:unnamed protein product [Pleuronectes platessa]
MNQEIGWLFGRELHLKMSNQGTDGCVVQLPVTSGQIQQWPFMFPSPPPGRPTCPRGCRPPAQPRGLALSLDTSRANKWPTPAEASGCLAEPSA